MGDEATVTERMKVTDADDSQCKDYRQKQNKNNNFFSNKQILLGLWDRPTQKRDSTQVLWVTHVQASGIHSVYTYSPFYLTGSY